MSSLGTQLLLTRVQKKFSGSGDVIAQLDLEIASGDFVALLGPSGCGKSTLLRLMAGLETVSAGHISAVSSRDRGFVFQDANLLPWRSALQNVMLPLELLGLAPAEKSARAKEALARVGLSDSLEKYPHQLSGGMKMRVSVARALVNRPRLLFLDEPFAALDENSRHALQEELRRIWLDTKMTIVFVTHSVSEAVFLADRSLVFSARPAQVVLDLRSSLPELRNADLRLSTAFIAEMKKIYQVYVKSGGDL